YVRAALGAGAGKAHRTFAAVGKVDSGGGTPGASAGGSGAGSTGTLPFLQFGGVNCMVGSAAGGRFFVHADDRLAGAVRDYGAMGGRGGAGSFSGDGG